MNVLEGYRFWKWFCNNHRDYLQLLQLNEEEREALLEALQEQLVKYCPGLEIEFRQMDAEDKIMIITANGYEQYFAAAEDLVLMAPKLKEWDIMALRPAEWDFPIRFEYKGIEVCSDELWFSIFDNASEPHKLGIVVYFKHYDAENEDAYFKAAGRMLNIILGEKSSSLDVPYLWVDALPEKVNTATTMELEDLPSYIEFWREQVMLN